MNKAPERADVSLEVAHLYLYGLSNSDFAEQAERSAAIAKEWVLPLISKWRDQEGRDVVIKVLLDDYQTAYRPQELVDRMFAVETIRKRLSSAGIDIDIIMFESAVAKSADEMLPMIEPAPPRRDYQFTKASTISFDEASSQMFFNFEPFPEAEEDDWDHFSQDSSRLDPKKARQLLNSVGTHVNLLFRHKRDLYWSCPVLSAWWQLLRLGMFSQDLIGDNEEAIIIRQGAPLTAQSTLTVLPTKYLETEHAVRLILNSIVLSDADRAKVGISKDAEDALMLMHRVRYLFCD